MTTANAGYTVIPTVPVAAWWDNLDDDQRDELRGSADGNLALPAWAVVNMAQAGLIVAGTKWVTTGESYTFLMPGVVRDHIEHTE